MIRYYYLIIQSILIVGLINAIGFQAWCESKNKSYYYPGIENVGFIRKDNVPFSGSVYSGAENQVMMTWNNLLYIKPHRNYAFQEDDLFFVFRKIEEIFHKERSMGIHYQMMGVIKITALKSRFIQGQIVKSFHPIRKGDLLKPYQKINPYISMTDEVPYIRAQIVASEDTKRMIGQGDIVYIDQGQIHGIQPGNVFGIYEHQEKDFEMSSRTVFLDPTLSYPTGQLLILSTERETSAALITWSKNEMLMVHELDVH
ncbi:peptidoglycan-binding protein LysM [Candidatus Magnetomorum sp. HK-1]|nr:peptidoglycan-binding protein LysM [Candidatus Magnetomorum sp. HK-1]